MKANWRKMLRYIGAFLLAIAFILPVSSCSNISVNLQDDVTVEDSVSTDETQREYRYAYNMISLDNPATLLTPLAFFWPVIALFYRRRRGNEIGIGIMSLESLLSIFSIWLVWQLSFLERLEIGGYLAFGGSILYLISAASEIIETIRKKRHTR